MSRHHSILIYSLGNNNGICTRLIMRRHVFILTSFFSTILSQDLDALCMLVGAKHLILTANLYSY